MSILAEQVAHAQMWPQGTATCVFGSAMQTIHVVSPPIDSAQEDASAGAEDAPEADGRKAGHVVLLWPGLRHEEHRFTCCVGESSCSTGAGAAWAGADDEEAADPHGAAGVFCRLRK